MRLQPGNASEALRAFTISTLRAGLRPLFPLKKYLDEPVATWPPLLGFAHDIKVPRRTSLQGPTGASNINILLAMLDRTAAVPGDVAECGVFRGASLVPMAAHLRQVAPGKHLFGFDSFAGFDDSILFDIGLGGPGEGNKRVGGFQDTSCGLVLEKLKHFRVGNVTVIPGFFRETLPRCAHRKFSFVHLDIGIYEAYKECLEFFYPRLTAEGVILLNDYGKARWPGCQKAVDEFLSDKPEKLQLAESGVHQKFLICKL